VSVITILAGGWSATQFDLRKLPGIVIAVNDSAFYAPRWDICVSMDRLWSMHRGDWIRRQDRPVWLRRAASERYDWRGCDSIQFFENDHESTTLSDDPRRLNGTHSGFCALNLAYHLKPAQLWLVGFDMARGPCGEAHWHPQYPWVEGHATGTGRLAEWATQFDRAAQQFAAAGIEVRLCGAHSPVPRFHRADRAQLEGASACAA
jgi:hypothetical protein